jgi:outer membrane protein assembly factor BamB
VYALSARNGAFLWKSPIPNIGNSSPAVANGVVYIGGYGGIVYALNAGSGAIIRSKTAGVNVASSSPAVVDGVVYLGSNDNYFYALDAKTGDILWRSNTNGWVSYSPAVYNGVVYASSLDGNVYALDAKTGNKIWNYDTTPSEYSWQLHTAPALPLSPAVVDGVVYFPVDFIPFVQGTTNPGGTFQVAGNGWTQIYALNAANGDKIWNATIGTSGQGGIPPVLSGGYLYTRSGGNILALNSGNGNLAWNFSLNSDSELIVDNGALYLSSEDGQIYALGQESNIPQPSSNIYFGEEMGIALVVFVAITISLIIILRRKRFLQNIPK